MICRVCKEDKPAGKILADVCEGCTTRARELNSHRLGDKVAAVTGAFGFKPTPGCGCLKRQTALNNVNMNGTKLEVAKALLQAIVNPEKKE